MAAIIANDDVGNGRGVVAAVASSVVKERYTRGTRSMEENSSVANDSSHVTGSSYCMSNH